MGTEKGRRLNATPAGADKLADFQVYTTDIDGLLDTIGGVQPGQLALLELNAKEMASSGSEPKIRIGIVKLGMPSFIREIGDQEGAKYEGIHAIVAKRGLSGVALVVDSAMELGNTRVRDALFDIARYALKRCFRDNGGMSAFHGYGNPKKKGVVVFVDSAHRSLTVPTTKDGRRFGSVAITPDNGVLLFTDGAIYGIKARDVQKAMNGAGSFQLIPVEIADSRENEGPATINTRYEDTKNGNVSRYVEGKDGSFTLLVNAQVTKSMGGNVGCFVNLRFHKDSELSPWIATVAMIEPRDINTIVVGLSTGGDLSIRTAELLESDHTTVNGFRYGEGTTEMFITTTGELEERWGADKRDGIQAARAAKKALEKPLSFSQQQAQA